MSTHEWTSPYGVEGLIINTEKYTRGSDDGLVDVHAFIHGGGGTCVGVSPRWLLTAALDANGITRLTLRDALRDRITPAFTTGDADDIGDIAWDILTGGES